MGSEMSMAQVGFSMMRNVSLVGILQASVGLFGWHFHGFGEMYNVRTGGEGLALYILRVSTFDPIRFISRSHKITQDHTRSHLNFNVKTCLFTEIAKTSCSSTVTTDSQPSCFSKCFIAGVSTGF